MGGGAVELPVDRKITLLGRTARLSTGRGDLDVRPVSAAPRPGGAPLTSSASSVS